MTQRSAGGSSTMGSCKLLNRGWPGGASSIPGNLIPSRFPEFSEEMSRLVFFRKNRLALQRPAYRQVRIVPYNHPVVLRSVKFRHLVSHIRDFRQRIESVRKSLWNPDHLLFHVGEVQP